MCQLKVSVFFWCLSYLVDVLAGELGNQSLNALRLGLDTDGGEESRDIGSSGGSVATDGEQKVSSEILHCAVKSR